MKNIDEIILHIGFYKTGSTSIQGFLKKNSEFLSEQGVIATRARGYWIDDDLLALAFMEDRLPSTLEDRYIQRSVLSKEERANHRVNRRCCRTFAAWIHNVNPSG